jgi:hypothetical protein
MKLLMVHMPASGAPETATIYARANAIAGAYGVAADDGARTASTR